MRILKIANTIALAALLVVAVSATSSNAQDAGLDGAVDQAPYGTWINHTGRGAVKIFDCNGNLCGHVVWTKSAEDAVKGCGLEILGNVKPVGPNVWDKGWIYSPERKKRFDVEIRPVNNDKLKLRGYAGMKLLGRTMYWTRAPADLELCSAPDDGAGKSGAVTPRAKTKTGALNKNPAKKPRKAVAAKRPLPKLTPPPPIADEDNRRAPPAGRTDSTHDDDDVVYEDDAQDRNARSRRSRHAERTDRDNHYEDDYDSAEARDENCRISVPYVDITFPCKKN